MLETDDDLYEQIYNYSFYKGKCMGYLQGTIKFHKELIRLENKYQKYVRRHPGEVIDERHSDMHLSYLEYQLDMDEKEKIVHQYVLTNKNVPSERLADKIFREAEYWVCDI